MGEGCTPQETRCDKNELCHNGGICCTHIATKMQRCDCQDDYDGQFCQVPKEEESRSRMETMTALVVFSAVIGIIVVTIVIALVFLQIKYYRNRKRRLQEEDKERNKISKPDAEEKRGDSASRLRIQPGYSWRQSVRKHSTTSTKVKVSPSRSVPEDLKAVGLTPAAFGGRKSTVKSGDRVLLLDSCDGNRDAGELVVRCFSADATVGAHVPSSSSSKRKLTNGRERPEQASINARAVEVQVEEDTVG